MFSNEVVPVFSNVPTWRSLFFQHPQYVAECNYSLHTHIAVFKNLFSPIKETIIENYMQSQRSSNYHKQAQKLSLIVLCKYIRIILRVDN